jgi:hypothetical protein
LERDTIQTPSPFFTIPWDNSLGDSGLPRLRHTPLSVPEKSYLCIVIRKDMDKGNKIKIEIIADEYFSPDALREIAEFIENAESEEETYGAKFKNANYTAKIELM